MTEELMKLLNTIERSPTKGAYLNAPDIKLLLDLFTSVRAQRNLLYENMCIEGDEVREMIEQADSDILAHARRMGLIE